MFAGGASPRKRGDRRYPDACRIATRVSHPRAVRGPSPTPRAAPDYLDPSPRARGRLFPVASRDGNVQTTPSSSPPARGPPVPCRLERRKRPDNAQFIPARAGPPVPCRLERRKRPDNAQFIPARAGPDRGATYLTPHTRGTGPAACAGRGPFGGVLDQPLALGAKCPSVRSTSIHPDPTPVQHEGRPQPRAGPVKQKRRTAPAARSATLIPAPGQYRPERR